MITINCIVNGTCLSELIVSGHAGGSDNSVICASVSCLTRTVGDITTRLSGVTVDFSAPKPGNVMLKIHNVDDCIQDKFSGITDFLIYGYIGVKRDYPDSIKLNINNKEWYDGSQKRWW